jgi:NADPH-dependent glutamate synthase beta subunit-like oxidoreductase
LREVRAAGFRAVFLAVGAQSGRGLAIEGQDLDGVFKAVDYLLNVNRGYRLTLGERVVVIGGGSVALDAARTAARAIEESTEDEAASRVPDQDLLTTAVDAARLALRAGARRVDLVSLESQAELPAARTEQGREELAEARREGIGLHFSLGPRRLVGEGGRVRGVELVECVRVFDERGRFSPLFAADRVSHLDADSVILAIGQSIDTSFLRPEDGVDVTPAGAVRVNPETMETTAPGVFAGGDAAFGPRIIIDAEAHGKRAAVSIHRYLQREESRATLRVTIDELPTREYQMAPGYDGIVRQAPPTIDLGRRVGVTEVETPFTEHEARTQAQRCLNCHVHPVYDAALCVMCGRCVDVCPHRCLSFVPLQAVALDARDASVAAARLEADPRAGGPTALLKDEEICIRCGLCAIRCPTGAFTMERFAFEEVPE